MSDKFDPNKLHARAETTVSAFSLKQIIHSCAHEIKRLRQERKWRTIDTAPYDTKVWITDGEWGVVGICLSEDEGGNGQWSIIHYAVCHEWPWEPTHWKPFDETTETEEA